MSSCLSTGGGVLKSFRLFAYVFCISVAKIATATSAIITRSLEPKLMLPCVILDNISIFTTTFLATLQCCSCAVITRRLFYHHGQEHLPGPALQRGHQSGLITNQMFIQSPPLHRKCCELHLATQQFLLSIL